MAIERGSNVLKGSDNATWPMDIKTKNTDSLETHLHMDSSLKASQAVSRYARKRSIRHVLNCAKFSGVIQTDANDSNTPSPTLMN
jgi:hypothetical protein